LTERIDQADEAGRDQSGALVHPDFVYRACALAGHEMSSGLQRIVRSGQSRGGLVAAARVCLARLGDSAAFASLSRDLDTARYAGAAIENMVRVGTRTSTALVIGYMERMEHDPSRVIDMGDTGEDQVFHAVTYLGRQIANAPASSPGFESVAVMIRRWRDWWASDSANGGILAIETRVPNDPVMRCLARKAEWGFYQALFDLSIRDTAKALTGLFRELANHDPGLGAATARTILAERGDEQEFARLVAAMGTLQYHDALDRLKYIGDLRSVGALVGALEIAGSRSARLTPKTLYDEQREQLEQRRLRSDVFHTLASMVNDPPIAATAPPTNENVARWRDWWAKGQSLDALKPPWRILVE
jgi:hypothetical protein